MEDLILSHSLQFVYFKSERLLASTSYMSFLYACLCLLTDILWYTAVRPSTHLAITQKHFEGFWWFFGTMFVCMEGSFLSFFVFVFVFSFQSYWTLYTIWNFVKIGQCWIHAVLWWSFWKWRPVWIFQCWESIRDIIIYPHIKFWW